MDKDITVDLNVTLYITLNPIGQGYGGRSVLSGSLKVLLRHIAMSAPDLTTKNK